MLGPIVWDNPNLDVLLAGPPLTAEEALRADILARPVIRFRLGYNRALVALSGVVSVPHERLMINTVMLGVPQNINVSSRGTAKCLAIGTRVIMADGSLRAVEDVRSGDQVLGPDSLARTVLGTSRGHGPLFRVRQTSAQDYVVNADHVLSTRKRRGGYPRQPDVLNITVTDFAGRAKSFQDSFRGYRAGLLRFREQAVLLDPYFLGLWLGDGHGNHPYITTADPEIVEFCRTFAASLGGRVSTVAKPGNKAITCRLVFDRAAHSGNYGIPLDRRSSNPIANALDYYGVRGPRSGQPASSLKHIPECYIANTEAVRLQVLAGLVDSDGTVDNNGYTLTFARERLATDAKRLADTLGFRTSIRRVRTTAQNGYEGVAWRIHVNGNTSDVPCRVARKRIDASQIHKNKDFRLSLLSIEPAGDGPWAGFEVDGDHLFLLEDGTVTHNSTTVCVLGASLLAILYTKRIATLSATGFRGGQNIFNELERWAAGGRWDDQEDIDLVSHCIEKQAVSKALVHRGQTAWQINFRSHSIMRTLPTNNEDKIRGERAHVVFFDEANTADPTLIDKVIKPFLNVKGGMATGGATSASNMAFFTTTVDYSWRPFMMKVQAAKDSLRRDYDAWQAMQRGDWQTFEALERNDILGYTYNSYDYTDTIIRERVTDRQGRRWKIRYPNANALIGRPSLKFRDFPRGIPFSSRGPDGRIQKDSAPVRALTSYAIEKDGIERDLYTGTVEESIWLAEQRNVVDTAGGDVYPHGLMDKVCCYGPNVILKWGDAGDKWRAAHPEEEDQGYYPPVMFECTDACVLGVDVASGGRDFASFTVIRVGPMGEGEFNPMGTVSLGRTDWSNVIWSEQHRLLSYKDIADKIHSLRARYNLFSVHEPWKDDWEWCRAIGMDAKGGGLAVRDALIHLDRPDSEVAEGVIRIYDPFDADPKVQGFKRPPNLPILDLISAQDTTNDRLVEFTLAQMKVGRLYIAKWLEESERPDRDPKLNAGYYGIRTLENQLRRIQQEPTARARTFYMPGSSEDVKNKKDAWASFIYGAKELRAHLLRIKAIEERPPAMGAVVSRVNSKRGMGYGQGRGGRAPGGRL